MLPHNIHFLTFCLSQFKHPLPLLSQYFCLLTLILLNHIISISINSLHIFNCGFPLFLYFQFVLLAGENGGLMLLKILQVGVGVINDIISDYFLQFL